MTAVFDPRIETRSAWGASAALTFAAVLTPLLAWLGPLGFAPLAALTGIFALAGLRLERWHAAGAAIVLAGLAWAAVSINWSPYRPEDLEGWTALKLVFQALLFWSAICAAARLSDEGRRSVLAVFAWGAAVYGAVLLVEGLTGAAIYRAIRTAIGDPIRPDLGVKNVAQGGYVLSVFLPAATLAAWRLGARRWMAGVMVAGVAVSSFAFGSDAPLAALALAGVAALAVLRWPRGGPVALAGATATFFLAAPSVVSGLQASGLYARLEAAAPLSWSMRMGYWRHAVAWIGDHPIRGWGLDASRMFSPGIQLHPHDSALQVWLELGAVGAVLVAAFWVVVLLGLRRHRPDAGAAAQAATATVYLVFGAVSFGAWQDWWLSVGGLAAAFCVAAARELPPPSAAPARRRSSRRSAPLRVRPSTGTPISE